MGAGAWSCPEQRSWRDGMCAEATRALEATRVQFTPDSQVRPSVLGSKGWRCLP